MNHLLRGTIVLLALFAAGICGVSLETPLFDEVRQRAAASSTPQDGGERPAVVQPRRTGDTLADSNFDHGVLVEANLNLDLRDLDLGIAYEDTSAADASADQRSNVMMHPKVRLFNGQEESLSEPCVCRCNMRCLRRWGRCRVR